MKRVCVLLAAYNGENYISEQLDSILAQNHVSLDIYISLDLSTDRSFEIVESYTEKYSNITMLNYGKRFGTAGQNFFNLIQSVDFSDYDYISLADQDDIWYENKLIKATELLHSSRYDAYSGSVIAFWEDGRKKLLSKHFTQVKYDYLFEAPGPGCTFVMSKKFCQELKVTLKNNPKTSSLWMHDWFCYIFARSNDFCWFIDSEPLMLYRQHDCNVVGANNGIKSMLTRAKTILSGSALEQVIFQADYLELDSKPIQLIKDNSVFSLLKLSTLGFQCRRKFSDKIIFSVAFLLIACKRALK